MSTPIIRAAGAVLWRAAGEDGEQVEVCLVHRPKYDDWSLPKGKLDPGEHLLATAVREVVEETGHKVSLGIPLSTIRYPVGAAGGGKATKQVHYWLARADDRAPPWPGTEEIDQLAFLPAAEAIERLSQHHDVELVQQALARLGSPPQATSPLVVLRHAKALPRRQWKKQRDADRPLEARGLAEADRLAVLLGAFGADRIVSSDARRCQDTVHPFGASARTPVQADHRLSEEGFEQDPGAAADAVLALLAEDSPTVVCSHRPVLPTLLKATRVAAGAKSLRKQLGKTAANTLPPGGFVVLHRRFVDGQAHVVAVERHEL